MGTVLVHLESVVNAYWRTGTDPSPNTVARLLLNAWYVACLAFDRGDATSLQVAIDATGKPDGIPDADWVLVSDRLEREKDDLAEEMMDLAVRRLSEMGLALSAVSCLVHGPAQDRTNQIIDDVDDLIRDLRRLGRERR